MVNRIIEFIAKLCASSETEPNIRIGNVLDVGDDQSRICVCVIFKLGLSLRHDLGGDSV